MADSDQSINNLRYNQVTQGLEGFGGGTPMWTPLALTADGGITQLTGEATAGPGSGSQVVTLSNAAVIGKVLTGYVSGAGTVAATDTILQAIQKLNGNTAAKLSTALTTLHTFAGVGGVATDTSVLQVDVTHTSVGINVTPPTATYSLQVAGSVNISGSGTDLRIGRDIYVGQDNTGTIHTYHIDSNAVSDPLFIGSNVLQSVVLPKMNSTQRDALTDQTAGCSIYNTTVNAVNVYNGTGWVALGASVGTATGTGTVTPSIAGVSTVAITVSGALTLHGPTGALDGQKIVFRILNDGSHSVTFATGAGNFRFGTTVPSYTNSVSLTDYVGCIYNTSAGVWDLVSLSQGF